MKYINICASNVNYSLPVIKIFFEKLLLERDLYVRYISKNKKISSALFEMLLQKQVLDTSAKPTGKKTLSFSQPKCNPLIVDVLIKLTQNLIIDLEKKLDSLKVEEKKVSGLFNLKIKSKYADDPKTTTPNNWHTTVNNLIELNINGHKFKKPREIILNTIGDYDKELESDDEDDEDDCFEPRSSSTNLNKEQKVALYIDSNEDQKIIIQFLTSSLSIVFDNFNSIGINKLTYLGLDNLKKIEYINNIIEVTILINFLQVILNERDPQFTQNFGKISSNSLITTNVLVKQPSNNSLTYNLENPNSSLKSEPKSFGDVNNKLNSLDISKDSLIDYLNNIFNCFLKFSENSLMHKEVEYLATFLSNRFCPDIFVETFAVECNFFKNAIERNIINERKEIPSNLANICEVLVRFFLTENSNLQKQIENSKTYLN